MDVDHPQEEADEDPSALPPIIQQAPTVPLPDIDPTNVPLPEDDSYHDPQFPGNGHDGEYDEVPDPRDWGFLADTGKVDPSSFAQIAMAGFGSSAKRSVRIKVDRDDIPTVSNAELLEALYLPNTELAMQNQHDDVSNHPAFADQDPYANMPYT